MDRASEMVAFSPGASSSTGQRISALFSPSAAFLFFTLLFVLLFVLPFLYLSQHDHPGARQKSAAASGGRKGPASLPPNTFFVLMADFTQGGRGGEVGAPRRQRRRLAICAIDRIWQSGANRPGLPQRPDLRLEPKWLQRLLAHAGTHATPDGGAPGPATRLGFAELQPRTLFPSKSRRRARRAARGALLRS